MQRAEHIPVFYYKEHYITINGIVGKGGSSVFPIKPNLVGNVSSMYLIYSREHCANYYYKIYIYIYIYIYKSTASTKLMSRPA